MLIEQITHYLQGRLSEEEAMELWVHLIQNPDDLALLKTYKMYREMFNSRTEHNGRKNGARGEWNKNVGADQTRADEELPQPGQENTL